MQIQNVTQRDHETWQNFVMSNAKSSFYHHIGWKKVIEDSFGHHTFYLMAMENKEVHGILPLVLIKSRLFGRMMCSMPFLNFGGICAKSEEAYDALIEAARSLMLKNKSDYVEFRHLYPAPNSLVRKEHKVSMTITLNSDPDALWNRFKSKHRTNIRRAAKNNLEVVRGGKELVGTFYDIISNGWRDLGTPIYHIRFFENILQRFGELVEIYVINYNGKPIATAFNGLFKGTIEGMWTYALREHASLQTNYLLYWEMIKDACLRGYKLYHLGRSTNKTSATFFKSKWNAETHQLYWEYLLNASKLEKPPELNVDNPKYKLAISLWKKMPVKVANTVGPLLSKNIP